MSFNPIAFLIGALAYYVIKEWLLPILWSKNERGRRMKFKDFQFEIYREWFFILPTIVVAGKDYRHYYDSFSIEVHWLVWHMRWRWTEG